MTEDVSNLMLEHLKRIRATVEHMDQEFVDMKLRMSAMEQALAQGLSGVMAQISQVQVSMGSLHRRTDHVEENRDVGKRLQAFETETKQRLARIEERLKLTDA